LATSSCAHEPLPIYNLTSNVYPCFEERIIKTDDDHGAQIIEKCLNNRKLNTTAISLIEQNSYIPWHEDRYGSLFFANSIYKEAMNKLSPEIYRRALITHATLDLVEAFFFDGYGRRTNDQYPAGTGTIIRKK
jgi:hypothetical protein